ncbi:MAG: DNA translocase FtsK 4TM domain-containing protein, partial [Hyphomicrobium sp.]
MPAAIEDRLVGWFGRAGGIAMLAVTGALWACLITWTVIDPSLTHATGGTASNALGIPGAIVSDLLLQTLGIGAVLAILAPTLWALELIGAQRIRDFRAKASFYPLSVLILAGGLSALPVATGWPLNHGFGGILGDLIHGLTSSMFGLLNPDRGGLAAGLVLFVGGSAALLTSIGIEMQDLAALLKRSDVPATPMQTSDTFAPAARHDATHRAIGRAWLAWPFRRRAHPGAAGASYGYAHHQHAHQQPTHQQYWGYDWQSAPQPQQPYYSPQPAAEHYAGQALPSGHPYGADRAPSHAFSNPAPLPGSRADWNRPDPREHASAVDPISPFHAPAPMDARPASQPFAPREPSQGQVAMAQATSRDDGFDASTDAASRTIAERFAPVGARIPGPPSSAAEAAPGT